jgi:very-short-patch-repair endonuclease
MLGIGYGPVDPGANTMSMNFGPLNRDGGWRRLNVAVTRARQEMMVFTSFDASMVDLNRTSARAVQDLKHFIEFADRGPQALAEAVHGSLGSYESPFEEAVAQGLMRLGWQVVPQIGVSRFRIDLGIVHPERSGDYLVGVECDGATYHSAATARDRDKVRAGVLQGLGWKLLRVWSTDWWVDKQGALQRLHAAIEELLEKSRIEWKAKEEQLAAAALAREALPSGVAKPAGQITGAAHAEKAAPPTTVNSGNYRITDFSPLAAIIHPDRFYDDDYSANLAELISHVVATEAPITDTLLIQRVARAHLFQRTGRLIRERVLELVERHHHLRDDPVGGRCVWPDEDTVAMWSRYRTPASEEQMRGLDDIPFEELRAAFLSLGGEDLALEVARAFGVTRLTSMSRQRLEAAMELARTQNAAH